MHAHAPAQEQTAGHHAAQGPPDWWEGWDGPVKVFTHPVLNPAWSWKESAYRRNFTSRDCAQPDLAHLPERRQRRATLFVSASSDAELQTLRNILHRRGWDDRTAQWQKQPEVEPVWVCEVCLTELEAEGAPCTSEACAEPRMAAEQVLALDWHALRKTATDLAGDGGGSRGDLLRRVGVALGISPSALGLE